MKGPLAGLMQQAQRMQEDMKRAQDEIAGTEITGQAGGGLVRVVMSGRHEVRRVEIDRATLKDDPEKGARAQKKIDAIVVAATQMLMATKTPAQTKTPWQWNVYAVLVFAIVCAWLVYKLFVPHR